MTPKRRAFVNAYLGDAKGNGTKAAISAGYSEKTAGQAASQLLKRPEVRAAIGLRLKKADIATDKVLERLGRIVHSEPAEVKAADIVNASKVILQVSGDLQDKRSDAGRITVNIGFLNQTPAAIDITDSTSLVMPPRALAVSAREE